MGKGKTARRENPAEKQEKVVQVVWHTGRKMHKKFMKESKVDGFLKEKSDAR